MVVPDWIKGRVAVALLSLSIGGASAIVAHEGMRPVAYKDPIGIVTICAGHTKTAKMGQVLTEAQCAKLLQQDVRDAEAAIKRLTTTKLTQRQYDALVSFVFNVGETAYAKSTLLRHINAGRCNAAADEFKRWDKANGRVLPGLTKRREAEAIEFRSGCVKANTAMPNVSKDTV